MKKLLVGNGKELFSFIEGFLRYQFKPNEEYMEELV